jgi:alkylated DNA repair dioxygenase AlkB
MDQQYPTYTNFTCHHLQDGHCFWSGQLPDQLMPSTIEFEILWQLHPREYHRIKLFDRWVQTPRWQQAYHKDYIYTGQLNRALPVPNAILPFWHWGQGCLDRRLNGILLNWYDGQLGHYIGKHRDSITNMIDGAPIVTISLGESRKFRLRPWRGKGYLDFAANHGTVFILPYATNLNWTHEVPGSKKYQGQRISITLRAFL